MQPWPPGKLAKGPTREDRIRNGMEMWRREMPKLDISGKEVCSRLVALNVDLMQRLNAALAPYGLKYPEYGVLATLRASGAPFQMSPKQLLETIFFTSGGMSNLLVRLEKKRLIARSSAQTDKRVTVVQLTDTGLTLAEETMAMQAALEAEFCQRLGSDDRLRLVRSLSAMLDA